MTLSELITELRFQLGGRQDITDAMLINYIYWTQRRLDVLVPLRETVGNSSKAVLANIWYTDTFTDLSNIEWVLYKDSAGVAKRKLDYKSEDELLLDYPKLELGLQNSGTPSFYARRGVLARGFQLLIAPPPRNDITILVHGRLRNTKLSNDDDTNVWTVEYPDLLIDGVKRYIETVNRNGEGTRELDAYIMDRARLIDIETASWEDPGWKQLQ